MVSKGLVQKNDDNRLLTVTGNRTDPKIMSIVRNFHSQRTLDMSISLTREFWGCAPCPILRSHLQEARTKTSPKSAYSNQTRTQYTYQTHT